MRWVTAMQTQACAIAQQVKTHFILFRLLLYTWLCFAASWKGCKYVV